MTSPFQYSPLYRILVRSLKIFCLLALPGFWFFSLAPAASLEGFTLEKPRFFTNQGMLCLSLPLGVYNEMALSDMLRDGASLELRITADIERRRSLLPNAGIAELEWTSLLRHDPLNRVFQLTLPVGGKLKQDSLLPRLLYKSWKVLELPLFQTSLLEKNEEYIIDLELHLQHTELPSWLERTLLFRKRDVVEPEQLTLRYKVE